MPANRRNFWGAAVGRDRKGNKRRIEVFKSRDGFDFVTDNVYRHHIPASRKLSPEEMRDEIAHFFGLRDVDLEFPHLGIYASSAGAKPTSLSRREPQRSRFGR
jgi:hypothetical protein